MSLADSNPRIGQLVKVLRGKDEDAYAIVIGLAGDRFVWIADGVKKRFDRPKKKNLLHLELLPEISGEVADSMSETGRVTNAKLRFAIQKYANGKGKEDGQGRRH